MIILKETVKIQDAIAKYIKNEINLKQFDYILKALELGIDARRTHLFVYSLFYSLENNLYNGDNFLQVDDLRKLMVEKASDEYPDITITSMRRNLISYLYVLDIPVRHCANIFIETTLVVRSSTSYQENSLVLERALNNEYPSPIKKLRQDVVNYFRQKVR